MAPAPTTRRFVIVYGDQGKDVHNAGQLFEWSAKTHQKEVIHHQFPGVPPLSGAGPEIYHVASVPDLVGDLKAGYVFYLAYFGHSWSNEVASALFIGQDATPGSNLSAQRSDTNAPVTDIPKSSFLSDAQIRLFGCRGGYGNASIASQLHEYVGVTVYAYENSGGSLFTQDPYLGHGRRAVKQADIKFSTFNSSKNTWLVPINGIPKFRRF